MRTSTTILFNKPICELDEVASDRVDRQGGLRGDFAARRHEVLRLGVGECGDPEGIAPPQMSNEAAPRPRAPEPRIQLDGRQVTEHRSPQERTVSGFGLAAGTT